MRKILLFILLISAIHGSAQVSMGFLLEGRIKNAVKGNAIDNYLHLGMTLKKYVTPRFNLTSGLGIRFFDASLAPIAENTDLVSFVKDHYPNEFYHISSIDYMRFTYATIPFGVEFKLTPFIRLSYSLENNINLGTNDTGRHYLQYGTQSVMKEMLTHNVSFTVCSGGVGVSVGVLLNPAILRNDINYTYSYMNQFRTAFNNSCQVNLNLWGDFKFKARKKKII